MLQQTLTAKYLVLLIVSKEPLRNILFSTSLQRQKQSYLLVCLRHANRLGHVDSLIPIFCSNTPIHQSLSLGV